MSYQISQVLKISVPQTGTGNSAKFSGDEQQTDDSNKERNNLPKLRKFSKLSDRIKAIMQYYENAQPDKQNKKSNSVELNFLKNTTKISIADPKKKESVQKKIVSTISLGTKTKKKSEDNKDVKKDDYTSKQRKSKISNNEELKPNQAKSNKNISNSEKIQTTLRSSIPISSRYTINSSQTRAEIRKQVEKDSIKELKFSSTISKPVKVDLEKISAERESKMQQKRDPFEVDMVGKRQHIYWFENMLPAEGPGLQAYRRRLKQFICKQCHCGPKTNADDTDFYEPFPPKATCPKCRPRHHRLCFIDDPPYTCKREHCGYALGMWENKIDKNVDDEWSESKASRTEVWSDEEPRACSAFATHYCRNRLPSWVTRCGSGPAAEQNY